jgi:hypothetical protein
MFALVKNDNSIKLFAPYSNWEDKNGVEYGGEQLLSLTAQQKQDLGIYDVAYAPRPDDRFYASAEQISFDSSEKIVKVTYTSSPKNLEDQGTVKGLKSQFIDQFKGNANSFLSNTDWMLVRKIERNVDIPESVVAYRAAVVAEVQRLETAINEATEVDLLISAVSSASWPTAE